MKPPVLIVLDTNVLVSALLKQNSPPGLILDLILSGEIQLALDRRIFHEYINVLARPRLRISPVTARQILDFLAATSKWVQPKPISPPPEELYDPGDLPFAEAALTAGVWALVTGNKRHFSYLANFDLRVLPPTEFLQWFSRLEE